MHQRTKFFTILVLLSLGLTAGGPPATQPAGPHPAPAYPNQPVPPTQTCAGFYDGFESLSLEAGWTWINEERWSLTERSGYLRIYTTHPENDPTYLVRETSNDISEVWAHLEMQPAANLQQAGIAIYQDDDNWLRLTRQTVSDQAAFFILASNVGGGYQVQFVSAEAAMARPALRIRRQGHQWSAEFAPTADGGSAEWTSIGHAEGNFSNPRVGLVSTGGESGESPVDFDDFCLVPVLSTPTPTPGDLTLTGQVYNAAGGPAHGISQATVSLLTCLPRRFQTLSGSDGRYSLFVPAQYTTPCDRVTLEVWAAGYASYSQSVPVADLQVQPKRDFALAPLPHIVFLPLIRKTEPLEPSPPPPSSTPTLLSSP